MSFDDPLFALAALGVTGIARRRIRSVVHACRGGASGAMLPDPERIVWRAIERELATDAPRRQLEGLADQELLWLPASDPRFPQQLLEIPDPPVGLIVRGSIDALAKTSVAVVGSRRATPMGIHLARTLSAGLGDQGLTIVSGLARGIDAAAHRGSLDSAGSTVAVLGGGHRKLYPAHHSELAREIKNCKGAVVSEYPPDWPSRKEQFPERNRLVSGLSRGVLVVEASDRSGSLITARMALEQGREVMAVPGPVGAPTSRGCHRLIKQGAALIENVDDVLHTLGLTRQSPPLPLPPEPGGSDESTAVTGSERNVLEAVQFVTTTTDQIVDATGLGIGDVLRHLARLELRGFVEAVTGGYIRRPSQLR